MLFFGVRFWLVGVGVGRRNFLVTGFCLVVVFWSATFLRDFAIFWKQSKARAKDKIKSSFLKAKTGYYLIPTVSDTFLAIKSL
jgi:hypothetical protein